MSSISRWYTVEILSDMDEEYHKEKPFIPHMITIQSFNKRPDAIKFAKVIRKTSCRVFVITWFPVPKGFRQRVMEVKEQTGQSWNLDGVTK